MRSRGFCAVTSKWAPPRPPPIPNGCTPRYPQSFLPRKPMPDSPGIGIGIGHRGPAPGLDHRAFAGSAKRTASSGEQIQTEGIRVPDQTAQPSIQTAPGDAGCPSPLPPPLPKKPTSEVVALVLWGMMSAAARAGALAARISGEIGHGWPRSPSPQNQSRDGAHCATLVGIGIGTGI